MIQHRRHLRQAVLAWLVFCLALAGWGTRQPSRVSAQAGSTPFGQAATLNAWTLDFSDDFDALNTTTWSTCLPNTTSPCEWGGGRIAAYTSTQVSVISATGASGNALQLKAEFQNIQLPGRIAAYGSGMVSSHRAGRAPTDGYLFKYGYLEARVKLPRGKGLWPTFAAFSEPQTCNSHERGASEINVLDLQDDPRVGLMSIQRPIADNGSWECPLSSRGSALPEAIQLHTLGNWQDGGLADGNWHVLGMDWRKVISDSVLTWYVDGQLAATRVLTGNDATYFDQDLHVRLSLDLGDMLGTGANAKDNSSPLEADMLVDYVKVWKSQANTGNMPPVVGLNRPRTAERLLVGDVVTLKAPAYDLNGNLSRVEFWHNGAMAGEDTTAPYEFAWTVLTGTHELQAKAVDAAGSIVNSNLITITPMTVPSGQLVDNLDNFATSSVLRSANLLVDVAQAQEYFGDDEDRVARDFSGGEEWLEWPLITTTQTMRVMFTAFYHAGDAVNGQITTTSHYQFFYKTQANVSGDGTPITPTLIRQTPGGWYKVEYRVDLPIGAVQVRAKFPPAVAGRSWTPQLGSAQSIKPVMKLMHVGDSVMSTFHRGYLYNALVANGYDVDFVGRLSGITLPGGDPDHEAHSGYTIGPDQNTICYNDGFPAPYNLDSRIVGAFQTHSPDIVLMLTGFNDLGPEQPGCPKTGVVPSETSNRLEGLVDKMLQLKPGLRILLSSLTRVTVGEPRFSGDVNARAAKIANARTGSVCFVDSYNNPNMLNSDYYDAVHFDTPGEIKFAQNLLPHVQAMLATTPTCLSSGSATPNLVNNGSMEAVNSAWFVENTDSFGAVIGSMDVISDSSLGGQRLLRFVITGTSNLGQPNINQDIALKAGRTYHLSFKGKFSGATTPFATRRIQAMYQRNPYFAGGGNWTEFNVQAGQPCYFDLSTTANTYACSFAQTEDSPHSDLRFRLGTIPGQTINDNTTFFIDDVVITDTATPINALPMVTLTSPLNNAAYTSPAYVPMQATASDSDGSIARVEFYSGTIKLGEDTAEPYEFGWTNLGVGTYTVSVRAIDNLGASADSLSATLTVSGSTNTDFVIYDEVPANDWLSWSVNSTVEFTNTAPVRVGTKSMRVTSNSPWSTLALRAPQPLSASLYSSVDFWVRPTTVGSALGVFIQDGDATDPSVFIFLSPQANVWTRYAIPLSAFGTYTQIKRVNIMDVSGQAGGQYIIDDLRLAANLPPPTTTTDLVLYDDVVAANWSDWSSNVNNNFDNTSPVTVGLMSNRADVLSPYGNFALRRLFQLTASHYSSLEFWIHPSVSASGFGAFLQDGDNNPPSTFVFFNTTPNTWQKVSIPISAFGALAHIKRVNLLDISGTPTSTYYLDDIRLKAASGGGGGGNGFAAPNNANTADRVKSGSAVFATVSAIAYGTADHAGVALVWRVQNFAQPVQSTQLYRGTTANFADAVAVNARANSAPAQFGVQTLRDPAGSAKDNYWIKLQMVDGRTLLVGPLRVQTAAPVPTYSVYLPLIAR